MRWPLSEYRRRMGWRAVLRWFIPQVEQHYGVWHLWWGPVHLWRGISKNDHKLHSGMVLR